jgi:hypothetical protein
MKFELIIKKWAVAAHVVEADDVDQADEIMRERMHQVDWSQSEFITTIEHIKEEPETPTHYYWRKMCRNNKHSVCSRWLTGRGGGFNNFLEDMGTAPYLSKLCRIYKSQPYLPTNCEWRIS